MVSNWHPSTFYPLLFPDIIPRPPLRGRQTVLELALQLSLTLNLWSLPPLPPKRRLETHLPATCGLRGLRGTEGPTEVTCLPATYPAPVFLLLKLIPFRNASPCNFLVNHALWTLLNKMACQRLLSLPTRVSYLRGNKRTLLPQGHFLWPLKLWGSHQQLTVRSVNDSTE